MVVDVSRFLLPAAALANVGVTINARALEHTLRKMLSHPLQEVQDIGAEIKASALSSCPTLIKYTREIPYLISAAEKLRQCNSDQVSAMQPDEWCIILITTGTAKTASWLQLCIVMEVVHTRIIYRR